MEVPQITPAQRLFGDPDYMLHVITYDLPALQHHYDETLSGIRRHRPGDAMLSATLAGCGLSQLPLWLVGKYLESGELKEVLVGHSGGEMSISALWPKNRQIRYVVDTFIKAAEDGLLD